MRFTRATLLPLALIGFTAADHGAPSLTTAAGVPAGGVALQQNPDPGLLPQDGFFAPRTGFLPEPSRVRGEPSRGHEFYFTRAMYSSWGRGWSWATDYPKADRQFLIGLKRMTVIDAYDMENTIRLDDPRLRRFPFLYALEVGRMRLSPDEVAGLRDYILAGGFLFIDDFWGDREWYNLEQEMRRVFPEYTIRELPLDHPAFSTVYNIDEIVQVPNVGRGTRGGPTWEKGGYVPHVRAIVAEDGRLLVAIHWNTDLGDAWEWADNPYYPLRYSNYAWQVGINFIVYAMTH